MSLAEGGSGAAVAVAAAAVAAADVPTSTVFSSNKRPRDLLCGAAGRLIIVSVEGPLE